MISAVFFVLAALLHNILSGFGFFEAIDLAAFMASCIPLLLNGRSISLYKEVSLEKNIEEKEIITEAHTEEDPKKEYTSDNVFAKLNELKENE